MFGYSFIRIYFIINFVYTIITFIFLHGIMARQLCDNYHKLTSKDLPSKEVSASMNGFYILSAFTGSIRLILDILQLIFNHKKCIWLYHIYKDDKKE